MIIHNNEIYQVGDIIRYKGGVYIIYEITEVMNTGKHIAKVAHILGGERVSMISEGEFMHVQKSK
jgi:hypothetical protein